MSKKTLDAAPKEVRLVDYLPPAFLVEDTRLDFDIEPAFTRVSSRIVFKRNSKHPVRNAPLFLEGEAQKLESVCLNGVTLDEQNYRLDEHGLTIEAVPDDFVLEVVSTHEPCKNTALSGLYGSGKKAQEIFSTQCEPEGFRRITYYPDRSDVLAPFTVTIHADKKKYPVLLSNGNLIAQGREGTSRHWVRWQDPFRKPCYLFALVAGKLDKVQDHFKTKSGRKILIEIYVEPGRKAETGLALAAIKKAMAWDEKTFNLEYDLNRFMIVAISSFNMGAMENKGLNIFNDRCVLGTARTTTDGYVAFIERVVGHEYFHNWTGDRVTCRDWFQLSLKEGLTVFREQEFCGAMTSPALERLDAVSTLRRVQFAEDAGAMAHPVRPAAYASIDNFYTATVYEKGSEVVRMIQTLVGVKGFKKGLALYFKRHDGSAATCDDFVKAMADANHFNLKQFMAWYRQAGTPTIKVTTTYDAKKKSYAVTLAQKTKPTPGQPKKELLHIPFAMGLLDSKGRDLIGTRVLSLKEAKQTFVFKGIKEEPIPSFLRAFSAPVRLDYKYKEDDLLFLMAHDKDGFNRWEAVQALFMKQLLAKKPVASAALIAALKKLLTDSKLDAATKAMSLTLPSEAEIGLALLAKKKLIDPIEVYEKRRAFSLQIAEGLAEELMQSFIDIETALDETAIDGTSRGLRALKGLCLAYLAKVRPEDAVPLAVADVAQKSNMTDQVTALGILLDAKAKQTPAMLALFESKFKKMPNIMDSWMSLQASVRKPKILASVKKLMATPYFTLSNPNRVSALIGVFAGNPYGFHAEDGSGYKFVADILVKLDKLNPLAAARLGKVFLRWRDFDPRRQKLMKAVLLKLKAHKLSTTLAEVVSKALAA